MNRLLLAIMTVICVCAFIMASNVRSNFERDYKVVDSIKRHGMPIGIVGSKYPSLQVQIIDDSSIGVIDVRLPKKLYSSKDTLCITIYKNCKGERLFAEI